MANFRTVEYQNLRAKDEHEIRSLQKRFQRSNSVKFGLNDYFRIIYEHFGEKLRKLEDRKVHYDLMDFTKIMNYRYFHSITRIHTQNDVFSIIFVDSR